MSVVEVAAEEDLADARERVADVAHWLSGHGIVADALASASTGEDARALNAIAHSQGANLIVAGAYGHSRLREWALGGVTRTCCCEQTIVRCCRTERVGERSPVTEMPFAADSPAETSNPSVLADLAFAELGRMAKSPGQAPSCASGR